MDLPFSPKNIIIRMPNWLGDLVMATPIIQDVKNAFPNARLTAMGLSPLCSLLQYNPHLDELFCFHKKNGGFFRRAQEGDVIDKLAEGKYDLGILLTHSFRSAWWFFMGGVKKRVGFSTFWRRPLLTHAVSFPEKIQEQHQILTYKHLIASLGIPISKTEPYIVLQKEEIERAREILLQAGYKKGMLVVGINAGAAYGPAKQWLPERFHEVALRLIKKMGACCIFFGDDLVAPLVKSMCEGLPKEAINMAGKTKIRELASLIHECDLFLTNDSGPMHLASALGVFVVALFGSTSVCVTGPGKKSIVLHKSAPCSPCFLRVCNRDFRCMKEIQVDEVMGAIAEALERIPRSV